MHRKRDPAKQREYAQRHYRKNRAAMIARTKVQKAENRKAVQSWLLEYLLRTPCVDCGEADPVVLEFDHQGGKDFEIGGVVRLNISVKRLEIEVAKCQVRCANCHRRKTYKERGLSHRG